MTGTPVRFGIDMLLTGLLSELQGQRIGLVTNDAAATSAAYTPLVTSRVALQQSGLGLARLFSPEHGLGSAADGAAVADGTDPRTGLPVVSLYGDRYAPEPAHLADLDLLLFDIPDVGARFYTYIWSLSHVMEACAQAGVSLWVLDRPNPLGGDLADCEGPPLAQEFSTFVGRWNIPVRHSLTAGELARLWQKEQSLALELSVIKCAGWERPQHWPQTGNPFVPPSPAMPSYETALLYPGLCLFEGTNLSEGRGTAAPFRQIGAPWLDAETVAARFQQMIGGQIVARPVQFTPSAGKCQGQACQGLMLHPLRPQQLRPVQMGLLLLAIVQQTHPDEFAWLPYPTAANQPGFGHFDRLVGRADVRQLLQEPFETLPPLLRIVTDTSDWRERVLPHLLY